MIKYVIINRLQFPCVAVMNHEFNLARDYENITVTPKPSKNTSLLHLIIAPAFNFNKFLSCSHWVELFGSDSNRKRKDIAVKKIMNNEDPRYYYL